MGLVVGDADGRIGMGKGKAREVPVAVQKAMEQGRNGLFKVALKDGTLHHTVVGKHGASTVTTQFTGVFRDDPTEQIRFMTLVRGGNAT